MEITRIHHSKNKIEKLEQRDVRSLTGFKPKGLWYSFKIPKKKKYNTYWAEWCRDNEPKFLGEYRYKIAIDDNKILKVKYPEQMLDLPTKIIDNRFLFDWKAISSIYSGFEILPEHYRYDHSFDIFRSHISMFYYTLDCPSGCIWDINIIKNIIQV